MKLSEKYPPSEPCSCKICSNYCLRPGWWTIEEAEMAIAMGKAWRMMLEVSPDKTFGVLAPSFKGNESNFALQIFSGNGCTFHTNGLCELFGTGIQPLECRFCHHTRKGLGKKCHAEIEKEWTCQDAKRLIVRWGNIVGLWSKHGLMLSER